MAALPKRQTSKSKRNKRRSHHKLNKVSLGTKDGEYYPIGRVTKANPVHKGKQIIKSEDE